MIGDTHVHVGDIIVVKENVDSKLERDEYVIVAITRRTAKNNPQPLIWYQSLVLSSLLSPRAAEFKKFTDYKSHFHSDDKRITTLLWKEHSPKWLADIGRREKQSFKGKTNRTLHAHQHSPPPASHDNENQGNIIPPPSSHPHLSPPCTE